MLRRFDTPHSPPGGNPFLPVRTRWFDDFLRSVVRPADQVVALGAGLDARAYRLQWPDGTALFELEQPELLALKEIRLGDVEVRPRCVRRTVAVDLAGMWEKPLLAAGFEPGRRTVWFAEGLLFYLSETTARELLTRLGLLSAPGSLLAVDLIGTGIFHFPYTGPFLRRLAEAGCPWRFGTDDPARFTDSCGWPVLRCTEPGRADAHYGRWPGGATADIPGLPRSYLVSASRRA